MLKRQRTGSFPAPLLLLVPSRMTDAANLNRNMLPTLYGNCRECAILNYVPAGPLSKVRIILFCTSQAMLLRDRLERFAYCSGRQLAGVSARALIEYIRHPKPDTGPIFRRQIRLACDRPFYTDVRIVP